ncbi:MAG: acyl dehydratase [Xanthobacteraceae bacterium]|nr:acyl dehydratase [Xanthobacteraceae bacterium]
MSTRYFEDVQAGQELPLLRKGPLTPMHLMRWSAATENWHRIHYDERFAIEHDRLPGLLVNGSLKQNFILQALKDWAGHDGWVWKVSYQFRAMDVVNSELTVWARVIETQKPNDFGLVKLALGIRNLEGRESTPGSATVALPYRNGPAIPYPFVPPLT